MNAPFTLSHEKFRLADLRQPDEVERIEAFVRARHGIVFHRPAWLCAVEKGTGNRALGLLAETGGQITGWLPLSEIHSPIFGRMLASSGFAVEGGALCVDPRAGRLLCRGAQELAQRLSCPTVELRGGDAPADWNIRSDSHSGFIRELSPDEEAQLQSIPRKQRAELRKGLANGLEIRTAQDEAARAAHYAIYAQSVRNLGTPVFPRSLFDAVMDRLDADILTVSHQGAPVASVLSLYHGGSVMPYWGGGTKAARYLRANDVMYFALMNHARTRGCTHFDFGRSKTGSGPWSFKKNWGFEPRPLSYASWTAPGQQARDADPASAKHAGRIAAWQKLPLTVANRIGPVIARGLG